MNLKNYTSKVPVSITLARIEKCLTEWPNVTGISKEIHEGNVQAFFFHTKENGKTFTIRLPAQVSAAQEALWEAYCKTVANRNKNRIDFLEQAERTAWKIMQDWIEIQISLIRLGQVEVLQVFMAFVWDGEHTFYEQLKGSAFKQLPEKT